MHYIKRKGLLVGYERRNERTYYCEVYPKDLDTVIDYFVIYEERHMKQVPDLRFWIEKYVDETYPNYVRNGLVSAPPSYSPEIYSDAMTNEILPEMDIPWRPASAEEAGLFYGPLNVHMEMERGYICIFSIDFGEQFDQFNHQWEPQNGNRYCTPEFKREFQCVVDSLRRHGPLKDYESMLSYCKNHGGVIKHDAERMEYGYIAKTPAYQYCLRCSTIRREFQGFDAIMICYDLNQMRLGQEQAQLEQEKKAAEERRMNEAYSKVVQTAADPAIPHRYQWYVVIEQPDEDWPFHIEDLSFEEALRIYQENDGKTKRIGVVKDEDFVVDFAVTENGESRVMEEVLELEIFSKDHRAKEAVEILRQDAGNCQGPALDGPIQV